MPTPYKQNCWFSPTYENPLGFSWFVFYLLNLVLKQRNFAYTNTLATITNHTQNLNIKKPAKNADYEVLKITFNLNSSFSSHNIVFFVFINIHIYIVYTKFKVAKVC